ncbi:MAG: hypothetical protein WD276_09295 [Actinomycetota bacterium]
MADRQTEQDERRWPGGRPIPPGTMDPFDRLFEQYKQEFSEVMRSAPKPGDFTPISEPTYDEAHRAWAAGRQLVSVRMESAASEVDRVVGEFKDGQLSEEQLRHEVESIVAKG